MHNPSIPLANAPGTTVLIYCIKTVTSNSSSTSKTILGIFLEGGVFLLFFDKRKLGMGQEIKTN
jgi:hypothetical protein